ncbi:hypothetical protein ACQEVC_30790 [Plantactinospora sp. CA-294935]|uniref:hypothetical protein n=1 Tax=Plantactinospora sp. CA-294935 TaxID=3240012 RepID=UPI003D8C1E17
MPWLLPGGVASPLVGAVADATSLRTALGPLIALPAVGWLLPDRARPARSGQRPGDDARAADARDRERVPPLTDLSCLPF